MMKKHNNRKGFTMAELLIVVAILVVLAGVAFVAVQNSQRSMTQLEYDTIAKEIFIAAQNHLTMAESQGYPGLSDMSDRISPDTEGNTEYGHPDSSYDATKKCYYYVVNNGAADSGIMLELMLPFGSVDETIRAGGSYIICYQPSSATVLDVFYSNSHKTSALTVNGIILGESDHDGLMASRGDKDALQSFTNTNGDTGVVGWYGDISALPIGEKLNDPLITVHNEEKLWVEIGYVEKYSTDSLVLMITGKTSGAKTSLQILTQNNESSGNPVRQKNQRIIPAPDSGTRPRTYKVVLDDITTSEMHFANLPADDGSFIPGEDLEIEAIAQNNTILTNIAYSGKRIANSLFARISGSTAEISNIRHLENLDKSVSKLQTSIVKAEQTKDLIWSDSIAETSDFISMIKDTDRWPSVPANVSIFKWNTSDSTGDTKSDCFFPVNPDLSDYPNTFLAYNGKNHSISGVIVDYSGDGGLFGSSSYINKIENLKLIDFNIKSEASAGALAGTLTNTTVTNVLVHNTPNVTGESSLEINGSIAGGLVGVLNGGTISKSAAAVYVQASGNAGGLVGTIDGTNADIQYCYSGGHTIGGEYLLNTTGAGRMNVIAGSYGGGLVGQAGSAVISDCYSTSSAKGATAGGLAGSSSGKIQNCYCTGLVFGTTKYSLVGETDNSIVLSDNYYYSIINEDKDINNKVIGYLTGAPNTSIIPDMKEDPSGVRPFDSSMDYYIPFVKNNTIAHPYDVIQTPNNLSTYYNNGSDVIYFLKGIKDFSGSELLPSDFVYKHYGDWPAPEIFIINQ